MNIEFVDARLPSRKVWILAMAPLAIMLAAWCTLVYLRAQLEDQRAELLAAQHTATARPQVPLPPRALPAYQADAAAAIKRAALPEADALAELENVAAVGIQLRSIDVNPAQSVVVVELDAASDDALGDYLDQLNAGWPSPRWHIQRLAALSGEPHSNTGSPSANVQAPEGHAVFIVRAL